MDERIMIDCESFVNSVHMRPVGFVPYSSQYIPTPNTELNLSKEDLLVSHHRMPGYALNSKRWALFHVDHITEVAFNSDAFQKLVLPKEKKRLISSLVRHRNREDLKFDDWIRGKGKGIIFLLYGEPGVGKTYTAGLYSYMLRG